MLRAIDKKVLRQKLFSLKINLLYKGPGKGPQMTNCKNVTGELNPEFNNKSKYWIYTMPCKPFGRILADACPWTLNIPTLHRIGR